LPIIRLKDGSGRLEYRWKEGELRQLFQLYQEGKTLKELSQTFSVNQHSLRDLLRKNRVLKKRNWEVERPQLVRLISQGFSVRKIAEIYLLEEKALYRILRNHQIPIPSIWKGLSEDAQQQYLHLLSDPTQRTDARAREYRRGH